MKDDGPAPDLPAWHLYVVRCRDGTLYTGIATDVERRLREHAGGRGARFLRGRGPLELVYRHPAGDQGRALRLEQRVKRLPRRQKLLLIAGQLTCDELWPDL